MHESEHILDESDIGRAFDIVHKSGDPLAQYPALASFIECRCAKVLRRLYRNGMPFSEAERLASITREAASIAALAMHQAIWRDLLPPRDSNNNPRSRYPRSNPPTLF